MVYSDSLNLINLPNLLHTGISETNIRHSDSEVQSILFQSIHFIIL